MIKKMREELGLSQEMVAGYLRISRSQLAMVEANRRDLNSPAYARFFALYNQVVSKENKKGARRSTARESNANKDLQQSIDWYISQREHSLTAARKRLNKLDEQHQRAEDILLHLSTSKADTSTEDQLLVNIIASNAQKVIATASSENHLRLQMKIQGLKAELKFLKDKKAALTT